MPAQFAFLGLALTTVTSDYATGGILATLQWTPRRGILFAARTFVTVSVAAGVGVVLTLASALAAKSTAGDALTLHLDDGLDMLARVGFVYVAGIVLAVGLGFLLRNTAGAIISAFLLILILPLLLPLFGEWMQEVAQWLPGSGAIYFLTGEARGMTRTSSVLVLSAWALGVLLLGGHRLLRDDANR
jgi:ABC-2 type transport system permease protein